jgi:uncharacterized membrane protein
MNNAVADRLAQAIKYNGTAILTDVPSLQRLLAPGQAEPPQEVRALVAAVQTKAVEFLQKWARSDADNKATYEQVREHIVGKMAAAGVLTAEQAGWALDAWKRALNLEVAVPRRIALEELAPPPPAPEAPSPAPSAASAQPSLGLSSGRPASPRSTAAAAGGAPAVAQGAPLRSPLLAPMGSAEAADADYAAIGANPYAPPRAAVQDYVETSELGALVSNGRSRPAGSGWTWIVRGWQLFKAQPLMWFVVLIVFIVVSVVVQIIPVIGPILGFLFGPALFAGIFIAARNVDQGAPLTVGVVFAGFRERLGSLVLLSLVQMLLFVAIGVVMYLVFGAQLMMIAGVLMTGKAAGAFAGVLGAFAGVLLMFLLLLGPVLAATYFATPLVALGGVGPVSAVTMSLIGCLKNILPFIVYAVGVIVLAIMASIPFLLGWILLLPVLMLSLYGAYRDIFHED